VRIIPDEYSELMHSTPSTTMASEAMATPAWLTPVGSQLSFSASEAAEILGTTVVSVNSSLQRARTRVKEAGVRQEGLSEPSAAE